MHFIRCPHCRTAVVRKSDGKCPACQADVANAVPLSPREMEGESQDRRNRRTSTVQTHWGRTALAAFAYALAVAVLSVTTLGAAFLVMLGFIESGSVGNLETGWYAFFGLTGLALLFSSLLLFSTIDAAVRAWKNRAARRAMVDSRGSDGEAQPVIRTQNEPDEAPNVRTTQTASRPKQRWYRGRKSSLLIFLLVSAFLGTGSVVLIKREKERSDARGMIYGMGGEVLYSHKSTWDSGESVGRAGSRDRLDGRDGRWARRSGKDRWGFDSPVLADGYEVSIEAAAPDFSLSRVPLRHLSPLRNLRLGSTSITDNAMEGISVLHDLLALDLGGTRVTDAGLVHIRRLTQLRWLRLWHTEISDAGLENLNGLEQLQWLSLSDTAVSDAGLAHIERLSQLEVLDLRSTKTSDAGVKKLRGALPTCDIIR